VHNKYRISNEKSSDNNIEYQVKKDTSGKIDTEVYKIFEQGQHSYTINLYRTTSCLLVNGKRWRDHFVDRDYPILLSYIKGNQQQIKEMDLKVAEILKTQQSDSIVGRKRKKGKNLAITDDLKSDNEQEDAECIICETRCSTKSAMCDTGQHWIHYKCDRLSRNRIINLEKGDETYTCRACEESMSIAVEWQKELDPQLQTSNEYVVSDQDTSCEEILIDTPPIRSDKSVATTPANKTAATISPADQADTATKVTSLSTDTTNVDTSPANKASSEARDTKTANKTSSATKATKPTKSAVTVIRDNKPASKAVPATETNSLICIADTDHDNTNTTVPSITKNLTEKLAVIPTLHGKRSQPTYATTDQSKELEKKLKNKEKELSAREKAVIEKEVEIKESIAQLASLKTYTLDLEVKYKQLKQELSIVRSRLLLTQDGGADNQTTTKQNTENPTTCNCSHALTGDQIIRLVEAAAGTRPKISEEKAYKERPTKDRMHRTDYPEDRTHKYNSIDNRRQNRSRSRTRPNDYKPHYTERHHYRVRRERSPSRKWKERSPSRSANAWRSRSPPSYKQAHRARSPPAQPLRQQSDNTNHPTSLVENRENEQQHLEQVSSGALLPQKTLMKTQESIHSYDQRHHQQNVPAEIETDARRPSFLELRHLATKKKKIATPISVIQDPQTILHLKNLLLE
jgi:hypothetical protein